MVVKKKAVTDKLATQGRGRRPQPGSGPRLYQPSDGAGVEGAACSGPLARLAELLGRIPHDSERWTLPERHDVGRRVQAVHDEATADGAARYGAKVYAFLQGRFDLSRSVFVKARAFADAFSAEEAARLAATRLGNGEPLSWAHARRLMEVRHLGKRKGLLARAVAESWTSGQLAKEVVRVNGGKRNRGGRRPSPARSAEQLARLLERPGMAEAARRELEARGELGAED
jgi:hypothetical protein